MKWLLMRKIKANDKKNWAKQSSIRFRRQIIKISALSSESISKYEFLTDEDVLPGKDLQDIFTAAKRFDWHCKRPV